MSRMKWRMRPIEPGDDPAIAAIIRQVMTEFGCSGPGFSIHDAEVDHMSRAYAAVDAGYWVLDADDPAGRRVVGGGGFGRLAGTTVADAVCELRKMYFLPEIRGLGAGRALMDHCLEEARAEGYRTIYLETAKSMEAARHLYEKSGFKPLCGPRGSTGHSGCDRYYERQL